MRFLTLILLAAAGAASAQVGSMEGSSDVGDTPRKGAVQFDAASNSYRVTGGGANMWARQDAFHFVWRRVTGDVSISADVRFEGAGAVAHRKAALIVRQNLDADSPYADAALHGDGLASLQYREEKGGSTLEVRSAVNGPTRLVLRRQGDRFVMLTGKPGESPVEAGAVALKLTGPVYVGFAVCSHDANVLETAVFSNVQVGTPAPRVRSKITIYDIKRKSADVIYSVDRHFEAPNWSRDGKFLMINSGGNLYRLPVDRKGAEPEKIDLGSITGCNNDHGISPDGRRIALSARVQGAPGSQVYLANADGSAAKLMTPRAPSYYHGWSPDGKWLAFTAQRNGEFDVYRVSVDGGEEQQLTTAKGLDDGPDYSPDGKWIYVNSDRTGNFDIWRFPADGSGPGDKLAQQVTNDDWEDWFPHPSPNGKWMVFVSFQKGTKGHPANQNVELRMMRFPGARLKPAKIQSLVKLFGGQGTINVNSWAPDSRRFAFVTYELMP